jgi:hypothetical protein
MGAIVVGSQVRYRDANLPGIGVVVSVGRTPRGGDCVVEWLRFAVKSEECFSNLTVVEEE